MVTLALIVLVLLAALVAFCVAVSLRWGLASAFTKSCWLPVVLLAAAYVFRNPLADRFGYALILVGLLIFLVSLIWTVVGLVLIYSSKEQGRPTGRLAAATLLASLPLLMVTAALAIERFR
jgi:hypothetical protein